MFGMLGGEKMFFYKVTHDGVIVALQTSDKEIIDDNLVIISEEEYAALMTDIQKQTESENTKTEQTKDERIAALEAENAALLYQVLTGEVLQDV